MNNRLKKSLIIAMMTIAYLGVDAQTYGTAIGLRGGVFSGITFKHNLGGPKYMELMFGGGQNGWLATGLLEIHKPLGAGNQLYWYYGAGGHFGLFDDGNQSYSVIGADGILALGYTLNELPFDISLDWKPRFNVLGDFGARTSGGALSLRYVF